MLTSDNDAKLRYRLDGVMMEREYIYILRQENEEKCLSTLATDFLSGSSCQNQINIFSGTTSTSTNYLPVNLHNGYSNEIQNERPDRIRGDDVWTGWYVLTIIFH
jgi:hypothetical protein